MSKSVNPFTNSNVFKLLNQLLLAEGKKEKDSLSLTVKTNKPPPLKEKKDSNKEYDKINYLLHHKYAFPNVVPTCECDTQNHWMLFFFLMDMWV